jgi:prepilin-type N-terminal cleavage/methylation domain-containing protein
MSFQRSVFSVEKKRGFTLVELLVVIAIIGLLGTFSIVSLRGTRTKARDTKRMTDLKLVQTALNLYYDQYGVYPNGSGTTCHAGNTGTSFEAGGCLEVLVTSGFLRGLPQDPDSAQHYRYDNWCRTSPTGGASSPQQYRLFAFTELDNGQVDMWWPVDAPDQYYWGMSTCEDPS